ncbi:MAG: TusE/DsrC/DsvC family sulfur relay protein [Micrococcales bacterium]|nr:TusE/DsrC/DsvC family sulfur relay protein [Micrococcales bacterium]
MPTTTIAGRRIDVNEEGFLVNPDEWDEALAVELARQIGIEMTDAHWAPIRFMREDYQANDKVTPTLRRMSTAGGFNVKELFALFPKKPAKKMSYIAGVPKPVGCV